jgi:hypothetical protein
VHYFISKPSMLSPIEKRSLLAARLQFAFVDTRFVFHDEERLEFLALGAVYEHPGHRGCSYQPIIVPAPDRSISPSQREYIESVLRQAIPVELVSDLADFPAQDETETD